MDDESALQARIAAVAGQINQHKQKQHAPPHHATFPSPSHSHHSAARWTPYSARIGSAAIHKNRSLVLGARRDSASPRDTSAVQSPATPGTLTPVPNGLVSTRSGFNNQLMTKQTFDRERNQKLERAGKQHNAKVQKPPVQRPPAPPPGKAAVEPLRILEVDGIKFRLQEDGSKLIRISESTTDGKKTPRTARVAGVDFFRTKKGNLVRAMVHGGRAVKPQPKAQCENFTKHGKCPFGPTCKFAHNPDKVAICKDFLYKSCPAGANCDLSHDPTYERVPACTHYLRGNCTKTACLYPHVNVSFDAPVCRPFATLGYCTKGKKCGDRHVFECPDYANSGHCASVEKGKCPLPHIDRAGTLRKVAQRQSKGSSPDESDLSSDEDEETEAGRQSRGAYSDKSEDIMMGLDDDSHELSQQRDYVALS